MKPIRTIIVDDEPLAIRGLEHRLKKFADIRIIERCRNGRDAIKAVKSRKPDLVFLDIQMPGYDGFAVIGALVGHELPLFVFVTAFDQYAMAAFDSHAIDYLLKPVDEERLADALARARKQLAQQSATEQNARLVEMIRELGDEAVLAEILSAETPPEEGQYEPRINIKDAGTVTCLNVDLIDWIDAAGDYMCIHAGGETHIVRETMKRMEIRLDPGKFQRVHRSAIVNLEKVKELVSGPNGQYFLNLENGGEVRMSRGYKDVIARFL